MIRKNTYVLREALGVPDNLYETSLMVYEELLSNVKDIRKNKLDSDNSIEFNLYDNFNISDFKFTHLILKIEIEESVDVFEPKFIRFYNRQEMRLTKDYRFENVLGDVLVGISILVPENYDYKYLEDFIKSERKSIIIDLNHELMHAYNSYKNKYDDPEERVLYNTAQQLNFGTHSINEFLYFLYFTTNIENIVRNSEVSAAIKENKISQKDFLKFLYSDETFSKLKKISNFSYDKLKSDLVDEIYLVDKVLKYAKIDTTNLKTEEKINKLLHLVFMNIRISMVKAYNEMLTENILERIIGFGKEKEKVLERFIDRQNRFKNHDEFFKFYEKLFKDVSNKMMRKIAKLYAIIK